jgi:lipopolysaccharide biosynthesis glycosyltransferase
MLHSFLAQNRWFNGDIVVIHRQLTVEHRRYLARIHENVRFLEVSAELQARVNDIVRKYPDFASLQARFYSLETFRLRGYGKVLFCDSDLLFRRPIPELFELPQSLVVCGDAFHYRDRPREWRGRSNQAASDTLEAVPYHDTFNSGVVLIGQELLTDEHYVGLLDLVDANMNESCSTIADQVVFNMYFAGQQHLISATYNYMLGHRAAIYAKEGLRLTDAHVLHYNGPVKPWRAVRLLEASQREPRMIKACAFWFDAYVACLQHLYLQGCLELVQPCVTPEAAP